MFVHLLIYLFYVTKATDQLDESNDNLIAGLKISQTVRLIT